MTIELSFRDYLEKYIQNILLFHPLPLWHTLTPITSLAWKPFEYVDFIYINK